MAKKEKNENGAKVAVHKSNQEMVPQPEQRPLTPALRTQHSLRWLRDEMDQVFDRFFGNWPATWEPALGQERLWDVDVKDTDNEIVVRAEAPGYDPTDFDINVSGNTLTIRAEHKEEKEENEEGYQRWERRYGQFQRSIPLSTAVDAEKAQASYRSGILEVNLPRTEPSQSRHIEVKA